MLIPKSCRRVALKQYKAPNNKILFFKNYLLTLFIYLFLNKLIEERMVEGGETINPELSSTRDWVTGSSQILLILLAFGEVLDVTNPTLTAYKNN